MLTKEICYSFFVLSLFCTFETPWTSVQKFCFSYQHLDEYPQIFLDVFAAVTVKAFLHSVCCILCSFSTPVWYGTDFIQGIAWFNPKYTHLTVKNGGSQLCPCHYLANLILAPSYTSFYLKLIRRSLNSIKTFWGYINVWIALGIPWFQRI